MSVYSTRLQVQWGDMDAQSHVNNQVYFSMHAFSLQ